MKTLIIAFCLFAGVAFAQDNIRLVNAVENGIVFTDSVGYTNLSETSDSVKVYDFNFFRGDMYIIIHGSANSPVDSFYLRSGARTYDTDGVVSGTTYGSFIPLQDSALATQYTVIGNAVGKTYFINQSVKQLVKVTVPNHRGSDVDRNIVFTIIAVKP